MRNNQMKQLLKKYIKVCRFLYITKKIRIFKLKIVKPAIELYDNSEIVRILLAVLFISIYIYMYLVNNVVLYLDGDETNTVVPSRDRPTDPHIPMPGPENSGLDTAESLRERLEDYLRVLRSRTPNGGLPIHRDILNLNEYFARDFVKFTDYRVKLAGLPSINSGQPRFEFLNEGLRSLAPSTDYHFLGYKTSDGSTGFIVEYTSADRGATTFKVIPYTE